LLYAHGRTPTEIAELLFCGRSSVYRALDAWNSVKLIAQWWPEP
jgi:hypothetical protein